MGHRRLSTADLKGRGLPGGRGFPVARGVQAARVPKKAQGWRCTCVMALSASPALSSPAPPPDFSGKKWPGGTKHPRVGTAQAFKPPLRTILTAVHPHLAGEKPEAQVGKGLARCHTTGLQGNPDSTPGSVSTVPWRPQPWPPQLTEGSQVSGFLQKEG